MTFTVAAFYQFTTLQHAGSLRETLKGEFAPLRLCGTLLIAPEGINGTLAGTRESIEGMLELLAAHTNLSREQVKFSTCETKPFNRLKIRLKREIITFNQPQADPSRLSGVYVDPENWNELLDDPELTLLDTRNVYETAIGTFVGAHDPQIETFTQFAAYVRTHLDPAKHKKVAMFCTGGIRCEKASAFMRSEGFESVYHLKGGILRYLEEMPIQTSKWRGDCYVFDKRIAVGHGLTTGHYAMCFCCGYPVTAKDMMHIDYEEGVSCRYCRALSSDEDKARFRTRQLQMAKQPASFSAEPAGGNFSFPAIDE